jgi:hypothetical protein
MSMNALTISSGLLPGLVIYVILAGLTTWHILRSVRGGWEKATWTAGVVLIPMVGILGYWWDCLWGSRSEEAERRRPK